MDLSPKAEVETMNLILRAFLESLVAQEGTLTVVPHCGGPAVVRWGSTRRLNLTLLSLAGREWVEALFPPGPLRRYLVPRLGIVALAYLVQRGGFAAQ
jgi:hypothetical protein